MNRTLVVSHYHLRPGGVRRVIETAMPLLAGGGRMARVILAVGESAESTWIERLRVSLDGTPLEIRVHPEFLYWSELGDDARERTKNLPDICKRLLADCSGTDAILWAHNLGLGRNIALASAWAEAVDATGAVFVSHHHDFFFDNRWNRWPEMRSGGTATLDAAAAAVFPVGSRIVHVAINRADHECLAAGFGSGALWIPNAVTPAAHGSAEAQSALQWVASRTGFAGPYWLLPCRLLRRKNMAEAVLLARWLRPEAHIMTTGAPTSAEESNYAEGLALAAAKHGWRLDLGILVDVKNPPPVSALIAGAETVLLTSLQEGFGLPYLEAASGGRPLLARSLPNVMPDLVSAGLLAPTTYEEVVVPLDLFDSNAEVERQRQRWNTWRAGLPSEAAAFCEEPGFLSQATEPVAFSRLTFMAQEEVLSSSSEDLHAALAPLNPKLAAIQGNAVNLPPAGFNDSGADSLSPERFRENFCTAVKMAECAPKVSLDAPSHTLRAFLRDRLSTRNLYPLLFSTEL